MIKNSTFQNAFEKSMSDWLILHHIHNVKISLKIIFWKRRILNNKYLTIKLLEDSVFFRSSFTLYINMLFGKIAHPHMKQCLRMLNWDAYRNVSKEITSERRKFPLRLGDYSWSYNVNKHCMPL